MLYECSCGFTAVSATAFYKHLAASKETGGGHQLTQARFADKNAKDTKRLNDAVQGKAKGGHATAAAAVASWVDEYLVVDQPDASAQPAPSNRSTGFGLSGVPVSVSARTLQQQPLAGPAPLADPEPHATPRAWGLGRQRSGSLRVDSSAARGAPDAELSPHVLPPKPPMIETDEVELVERASSYGRQGRRSSLSGAGSGAAQAALRMSMNAVVVGLSPWRWFGSPSGKGAQPEPSVQTPGEAACAEEGQQEVAFPGFDRGPSTRSEDDSASPSGDSPNDAHAVACHPQGACAHQDPPTTSLDAVQTVRDVFTWRHPWHTCRVFGAGLYAAVCARQLVKGHDLLQPSTALLAFCFLLLLRNAVREAMARYRRAQQQGLPIVIEEEDIGDVSGHAADGSMPNPSSQAQADTERRKAAMQLQQRVEEVLGPAALGAARYGAALVVLGAGLLSGRRAITSALVAALLWLGMVVGELRVISQPTFWLLCYVVAFTVPAAYSRCRRAMDAGVEAALRFVVRVLMGGSRGALLASGAVAAVLMAVLPLNFVLRASLAGAGAFGVLLWQSESPTARGVCEGRKHVGQAQLQGRAQLAGDKAE